MPIDPITDEEWERMQRERAEREHPEPPRQLAIAASDDARCEVCGHDIGAHDWVRGRACKRGSCFACYFGK